MENSYHLNFIFSKKDFDFSCIYKLTSPSNKIYIGQTQKLYKRFKSYRLKKTNPYLKKAIEKHGAENIKVEILEKDIPLDMLDDREQFYLDLLQPFDNNGYNICKFAGTTRGRKRPKEEMQGITDFCKKRTGVLHPLYGTKLSQETKDKISNAKKGKITSEETKLKLSKALSGKFNKCVKQICPITNNIINVYDSIKDACETTGASRNKLSCVLNNRMGKDKNGKPYRYLTTKGYKWEFC